MSYGSAGAGTMTHLAGELFKHLTDTPKIVHVPVQGRRPEHQRSGRRRGAIRDHQRHRPAPAAARIRQGAHPRGDVADRLKGAPNFPTAVEAGLPNMVATLFTGLLAPAGTPKPIIDQVYQATQKLMQDPAMQKALTDQGLEPIVGFEPGQDARVPEGRGRALDAGADDGGAEVAACDAAGDARARRGHPRLRSSASTWVRSRRPHARLSGDDGLTWQSRRTDHTCCAARTRSAAVRIN